MRRSHRTAAEASARATVDALGMLRGRRPNSAVRQGSPMADQTSPLRCSRGPRQGAERSTRAPHAQPHGDDRRTEHGEQSSRARCGGDDGRAWPSLRADGRGGGGGGRGQACWTAARGSGHGRGSPGRPQMACRLCHGRQASSMPELRISVAGRHGLCQASTHVRNPVALAPASSRQGSTTSVSARTLAPAARASTMSACLDSCTPALLHSTRQQRALHGHGLRPAPGDPPHTPRRSACTCSQSAGELMPSSCTLVRHINHGRR